MWTFVFENVIVSRFISFYICVYIYGSERQKSRTTTNPTTRINIIEYNY